MPVFLYAVPEGEPSGEWKVESIYSGEYVLGCGKDQDIRKGDEFYLLSEEGSRNGKLYAVRVTDDLTFARAAYSDRRIMAGDSIERIKMAGFGTRLYCDYIFGENALCCGAYQEYFRGFLAFRPVAGIEYADTGSGLMNLYGGLRTMHRFGRFDVSALLTVGRGCVDGDFCYSGGSMKLTADYPLGDHILFSGECGYTSWLPDHDDERDEISGFLIGCGITVRF